MALSAKEREKIVEEERLRYETRMALHKEYCAKHRSSRWLWWLAAIALACLLYHHLACGGRRCPYGYGAGMMWGQGHSCQHGQWADSDKDGDDKAEPGQPLPPKK